MYALLPDKPLVLSSRLSAAADWERYTARWTKAWLFNLLCMLSVLYLSIAETFWLNDCGC
jgi:hypothetical protein